MNDSHSDWNVEVLEDGRSGFVYYREAAGTLSFFWEFGGGQTGVIVSVGDHATWQKQYPWAVSRRAGIIKRVADEVIRQKAPGCRAEIDERQGRILLHSFKAPSRTTPSDKKNIVYRLSALRLKVALVLVVLILAAMGIFSFLSIRSPVGSPLGQSVRASTEIVTIIQTLERYIPTLHRNPEKDRYRLSLFVFPADGSSKGRMIPIGRGFRVSEIQFSRILGVDGTIVWYVINRIEGVNLKTGKRVDMDKLRSANSSLSQAWDDQRLFSFGSRLRLTTPDRGSVYEIDPDTLQAVPSQIDTITPKFPFGIKLDDYLSAGARPAPTEWLGLLSSREATQDYKVGSWLRPVNRAENAKEMRTLYRGSLGPELAKGNREILSMTQLSTETYLNAAFVRAGPEAEPIRLTGPDGFLMIYTSKPGLISTVMVARVDTAGKILWSLDTGLDRFLLKKILPDSRYVAFVGTVPPVPDQVSEPMLTVVDVLSGTLSSSSLWQ